MAMQRQATRQHDRDMTGSRSPLLHALHADGPAPDRADKMGLYAWLIGSWTMEGFATRPGGETHKDRGEIHAGFVLGGRAIQDVWIFPTVFHGSTLRIYDPGLDAWHVLWSDPLKQYYVRQIGRAAGNDIVQEGRAENGDIIRWRFIERTNDQFRWLGERSDPSGNNFKLQAEFFARRVK
jgi:hypothetical protein